MEKYNIIRKLASGSYGDIFIASNKKSKYVLDNYVVVKKLFIKDDLEMETCKL